MKTSQDLKEYAGMSNEEKIYFILHPKNTWDDYKRDKLVHLTALECSKFVKS